MRDAHGGRRAGRDGHRERAGHALTRAVVLGAGIGGLAAAAALRHSFGDVLVLERDRLVETGRRRGVPQGGQLHNLLGAAQVSLEMLIPSFLDTLVDAGAVRARVSSDTYVRELGQRMPERDLGLNLICAPRQLIESAARGLLCADARVQILDGCDAEPLPENGVRYLRDGRQLHTEAELVVDARGASAPLIGALRRAGRQVPEQVHEVGQWYVTTTFRLVGKPPTDHLFWMVFPVPPQTTGVLVSPLSAGRFHVSVSGRRNNPVPRTAEEVVRCAVATGDPVVPLLLASCEPISEPTLFRSTRAVWRRLEPQHLPPALLPIGDTCATLNPLFGQGMSVACLQAVVLLEALADAGRGERLTERYLRGCTEIVQRAWDLGQLVDSDPDALDSGYGAALAALLAEDPDLHRDYVAVWHLLTAASRLEAPDVVSRIRARMGEDSDAHP